MNEFKLGDELKDKVTGFKGIAISKIEYLNGCVQYCLKPKQKKSDPDKMPDGQWLDQEQLELVSDGINPKVKKIKPSKKLTGGDYSVAPKL